MYESEDFDLTVCAICGKTDPCECQAPKQKDPEPHKDTSEEIHCSSTSFTISLPISELRNTPRRQLKRAQG